MTKQYVNLHNHTTSSLLDGLSKPERYCGRAKELGQDYVVATEHGNVFGLLDMYDAAKKHGLKFFPGQEFYQARKTRFDMDEEERAGRTSTEWEQRGPYHLGVIAYNNTGYHNLIKLSSRAFLEGYYVKPRVDHELLAEHSEGLIMLSGCLSGEIQQALLRDDFDFALNTAAKFQDIVGRDNFFIEIQNHHIPEELHNHAGLLEIAKIINAPIVATCDSHYTCKEDAHAHDILLCTNTKSKINTPDRFKFSGDHFYLKSYDEMAQLFLPEWLDNTMLVADKYDLDLKFGEYHIPNFAVPDNSSQTDYFMKMVFEGATRRFGDTWRNDKKIVDRIDYETRVIIEMGFPNYFLIVSDIMNFAHSRGIMCGAGRGSAAGCIVSYCLNITQLNPLDYDLPFERFLVPGRKALPDIDLDIDDRYRDEVIEYTRQKYGYDHTAQIITFSEIGAKMAVKDVARTLDYPFEFGKKINDAMPPALYGVTKSLEECLETTEFKQLYDTDDDARQVIDLAQQFEGLWRQSGVHAAGLVISDKPVTEYVPVIKKGADAPVVTQWDMARIDQCGLLKVDFLGLRNLSIVDMAFDLVEKRHGIKIDDRYGLVKENDPTVYEALSRGENVLVFQLESSGIRQLMIGMKPSNINDISALLSLYRPGPMGSNVHNEYVERKHGRSPVTYLHPLLKPILEDTYGLLLYQEQLLRIAREIAGFDPGEADNMRKIVGKKKPEEMVKVRDAFVNGCMKTSNFSNYLATTLFNEIEHHASYSFGKNHAMAYSYLSYVTSWLRTKYPIEAMTAGLSSVGNNKDRLRLYLGECKRMGINVSAPSINYSTPDFSVKDDNTIIYGFGAMRGIGDASTRLLSEDRAEPYTGIYDFLRRVDGDLLNRDTMNHFVSAGCFDELLASFPIDQPELTRVQRHKILYEEMEELGVFLSDHPLNDAQDLIAGNTTHTISELSDLRAGENVLVAGVVLDITKKITRAGKRMYNVLIDDIDASIMVSIVPRVAANLPDPPFEKGAIIIVNGKLDKFGDDENAASTITCFEIKIINPADLIGGRPIILSTTKDINSIQLDRLNDIIETTSGNSPVYLEFLDGNKKMKFKFKQLTSSTIEPMLKELLKGII